MKDVALVKRTKTAPDSNSGEPVTAVHYATGIGPKGEVAGWTDDRSKAIGVKEETADMVAAYYRGRANAGRIAFESEDGVILGAVGGPDRVRPSRTKEPTREEFEAMLPRAKNLGWISPPEQPGKLSSVERDLHTALHLPGSASRDDIAAAALKAIQSPDGCVRPITKAQIDTLAGGDPVTLDEGGIPVQVVPPAKPKPDPKADKGK